VGGRDRHEAAVAGLAQRIPGVLREQERARQQERDERVPALLRELGHGGDVLEAGVGDDRVEASEPRERGIDDRAVSLARRQVAVGDVDAVHQPGVRFEPGDDGRADPAGGAGDERRLLSGPGLRHLRSAP
jgi:hypothetical protein